MQEKLLTQEETAIRLNISVGSLTRWRKKNTGPPVVYLTSSRGVRYPEEKLQTWINERSQKP